MEENKVFNQDNVYYKVENIITRKLNGKNKLYLIKWAGYNIKYSTWEPVAHLDNIMDLVETFDKNFPKSINKRQLRKYLRAKNKRSKNKIKRKDELEKKSEFKNDNVNNNHFIINLEDFDIFNGDVEDNKECLESENEKEGFALEKFENKKEDIEIKEEEIDTKISQEEEKPKLIRPILIW